MCRLAGGERLAEGRDQDSLDAGDAGIVRVLGARPSLGSLGRHVQDVNSAKHIKRGGHLGSGCHLARRYPEHAIDG